MFANLSHSAKFIDQQGSIRANVIKVPKEISEEEKERMNRYTLKGCKAGGARQSKLVEHIAQARRSRPFSPEGPKDDQWRWQIKDKFGGTIREDRKSAEQIVPTKEKLAIGPFGDTVDSDILEDLDDDSDDDATMEAFVEDIFNSETQLSTDQSSALEFVDAGWDVESIETEASEESNGWAVESTSGREAVEAPPKDQKSHSLSQEDKYDRWKESSALQSLPRDVLKKLQEYQDEADELRQETKRKSREKGSGEQKTHRRLRVVSGDFAGRRLLSGTGELTRPMMEVVRAAAFDMLLARCGSMLQLPPGSKWLDLFAGTGSVGVEAMSRGAESCHFIEMDKWVVDSVLMPNLSSCQVTEQSMVHTMKAEDYLKRANAAPEYATSFDFISVCPPYLKVSYPELFQLLTGSPLVHEETHILVEYPRKEKHNIPQSVGPLIRIRDRRFGRTNLAIYGPE